MKPKVFLVLRLGGERDSLKCWRSKGDRVSESLSPLLSIIFNDFLSVEPFHDAADFVLGGIVLARGTANIADQLFGWHATG